MRTLEQIIAEHPFWKRLNPHYLYSAAGHRPGRRWPMLSYICPVFYLFNCRSLTGSSSLGTFSNLWPHCDDRRADGVCPRGVHERSLLLRSLDAAAWLLVSAVALAASLVVGFEKWVRGQDEKKPRSRSGHRPLPQPS